MGSGSGAFIIIIIIVFAEKKTARQMTRQTDVPVRGEESVRPNL
jgi:hypothetical protein